MSKFYLIFTKTKNSFEGQLPDENVLSVVRMHWFILLRSLLPIAVLLVFPFVIVPFLGQYFGGEAYIFIWSLAFLYLLYVWYFLFYGITIYLLNVWIITDHRIIASEQLGLFNRKLAEIQLAKIQDISVEVYGLFGTFLSFGDLEIQSAGAEKKFKLKSIADPSQVKDKINQAYNKFIKYHPKNAEL